MAHPNGFIVWLTGMSCTGKSTLASYIAARFRQVGRPVEILDEGDMDGVLWEGIPEVKDERNINVRRIGFLAQLLARNNVAVLVSAVSPYKGARDELRRASPRFVEVYVDCPTEVLIERDGSGRYKRALGGEIPNFIGITEPYEPPSSPEVTIQSDQESVEVGAGRILQSLLDFGYVNPDELKVITGKRMKANPVSAAAAKKARRTPAPAKPAPAKGAKARPAARAARVSKPATAAKKASKKR